ncbi:DKNYY domain-containing protein [Chitinophaga alhagiae]|uniref:DKNYY domain-containing protein n=1 Tax=Chitinophaga alhagiae TaxID=2203219 RepID=UPI000E5BCFA4|nr:DKNYY domain-containing protein [Chitinophaga alhagiae]
MSKKALDHGFFIIDNKFILHFDREVYRKFYPVIDFASFEIIESNGATFHYFRDKHRVYIESYMNAFAVLPDAASVYFKVLDFERGKSTSNGNDYLFDQKLPHRFDDYRVLSNYYQFAAGTVYFNYFHAMPEADIRSFEVLHGENVGNVAKDKKHVYFRDKVVDGADPGSFHFLEECFSGEYYRECDHTYYAIDKHQAYYVDTIARAFKAIRTKDTGQFHFKVINELGYAFDEKYAYLFGKRKPVG